MTNQENGVDLKSAAGMEEKKLFIETYGCQMNVADSEVVASIMKMDGYAVTDKIEDADAIFRIPIWTCRTWWGRSSTAKRRSM